MHALNMNYIKHDDLIEKIEKRRQTNQALVPTSPPLLNVNSQRLLERDVPLLLGI